jgi:hypothetical protein
MDNLIIKLKEKLTNRKSLIKDTVCDYNQFEKNCYNQKYTKLLETFINHLEETYNLIGLDVYKYEKSFNYITKEEYDKKVEEDKYYRNFNPIKKDSIIFTKELHEEFRLDYCKFLIKRCNEDILNSLNGSISTSDFYNAVVRTSNKGKMEFIGLLNDIIDNFF